MKRVQLIVTGVCERNALHDSLKQLFPELEFPEPLFEQGFTSTPISDPPQSGILDTAFKFAKRMVGAVDELDEALVIGVEDQEDEHRPSRQLDVVRTNVHRALDEFCLQSPPTHRQTKHRLRLAEQVAARCSFHLLMPMVEAYFFGDTAALLRAGAKPEQSKFDGAATDVERFSVTDERFTARQTRPTNTTGRAVVRREGSTRRGTSSFSPEMACQATTPIERANTVRRRCGP